MKTPWLFISSTYRISQALDSKVGCGFWSEPALEHIMLMITWELAERMGSLRRFTGFQPDSRPREMSFQLLKCTINVVCFSEKFGLRGSKQVEKPKSIAQFIHRYTWSQRVPQATLLRDSALGGLRDYQWDLTDPKLSRMRRTEAYHIPCATGNCLVLSYRCVPTGSANHYHLSFHFLFQYLNLSEDI